MDVWNYILGYRNTLKSVFETWVVHIPFKPLYRVRDRAASDFITVIFCVDFRRDYNCYCC